MTPPVKQSLRPDLDALERSLRRWLEALPLLPFVQPETPAADVYETPDELVFELEVPGYEQTELVLEVEDHRLTVSGERQEHRDETAKTYRVHERLEQHFERTFVLPEQVDGEHISATFDKGLLKVHVPKLGSFQPRRIPITP